MRVLFKILSEIGYDRHGVPNKKTEKQSDLYALSGRVYLRQNLELIISPSIVDLPNTKL